MELVEEQHRYLAEDPENVVVIHCKVGMSWEETRGHEAGKGRTGLVTSCLLLREGGEAG